MNKEELEYQLEKLKVEVASLKLRIKTIKRRRKQESAKRRLLHQRIDKAIEIYENKNTCKYKKQRFMEDKTTADLMYEAIKGSEE